MTPPERLPAVLIVDDEPANLATFRRVFRKELSISEAASGAGALRLLAEQDFDVVFADFAMPDMTGVELLEATLRVRPEAARVLLTAYWDRPELRGALDRGIAVALITKPWSRNEILDTIRRAVSEKLHRAVG